jgi:hypothetical protein
VRVLLPLCSTAGGSGAATDADDNEKRRQQGILRGLAPVKMVRCVCLCCVFLRCCVAVSGARPILIHRFQPGCLLLFPPLLPILYPRVRHWDARVQVLTPANFATATPRPGPPLERIGSGGGMGGRDSASSLRFSMLGFGTGSSSSISLRNVIGIGARNASGPTVDDEIRIPVPGFLLPGGLEEAASLSLSLPEDSASPMRWAAGSCTVCLGSYQIGESVTWSSNPDCEHCFHTSCIEEWVLRRRPQKNNHRRRRVEGADNHEDDDEDDPLCPNCRRPFVVVGPFEGGGGGRGTRAGTLASGTGLPVVTGNDSINIGAAARAAAHNADPFEGTAGGSTAVSSGAADSPPATPDAGGGSGDGDGGASSSSDGPCPHSIDV